MAIATTVHRMAIYPRKKAGPRDKTDPHVEAGYTDPEVGAISFRKNRGWGPPRRDFQLDRREMAAALPY
jgi:hypothetical protein